MRFSTSSFLLAFLTGLSVVHCVSALSVKARDGELPTREVSPSRAVFEFEDTALMAPHDVQLVRRVAWTYNNNQKLFMTIVVASSGVAAAGCQSGIVTNCLIGVAFASFLFFFSTFFFSDRADTGDIANAVFFYPALPGKTHVQRLQSELEPGQWHYVGHVHKDGLNHTVEYFNTGTIQRLRARNVPFWNETQGGDLAARQDPDNDGGFVGDYSWISNNEGPYDSFHSTTAGSSYFAANAGGWIGDSSHSIASCASFSDAQGTLNNGLFTVGWNNKEFQWTEPGEEEAAYNDCASQE